MSFQQTFRETLDDAILNRRPVWQGTQKILPGGEVAQVPAYKAYLEPETFGDKLGYAAGRFAGDFSSDGSRNHWWRWNAAQALMNEFGQKIGKNLGLSKRDQILMGMGLTGAMEISTGNVDVRNIGEGGRPQGRRSLFPVEVETIDPKTGQVVYEEDFTRSSRPFAEMAARYFLGRTGSLMPYEDLIKELPHVTPEEYQRYQSSVRDKTLFGWEDADRSKTTLLGSLAGTAIGAITKQPVRGALLGSGVGNAVPPAADVFSELGLLRGTRDTFDDPIGEVEVMGYRVPIAQTAMGTTTLGGTAIALVKAKQLGAFDHLKQLINKG